jgi:hypothetical protein
MIFKYSNECFGSGFAPLAKHTPAVFATMLILAYRLVSARPAFTFKKKWFELMSHAL